MEDKKLKYIELYYSIEKRLNDEVKLDLNFNKIENSINEICEKVNDLVVEVNRMSQKEQKKQEEIKDKELEALCLPLVEYLKANYDLHTSILISEDYIKVVRDEIGISLEVED